MATAPKLHQLDLPTTEMVQQQATGLHRWRHQFSHQGRRYTLFKVVDSRDGSYYIHLQRLKKRFKHSLETNNLKTAETRAKLFIDSIRGEKWDVVARLRSKDTQVSTLKQVFDEYGRLSSCSPLTIRNNILSILKMIERVDGLKHDPATVDVPVSRLTQELVIDFQSRTAALYAAQAPQDDVSQRECRDRAFRSSRSTVQQARSVFTSRADHNLLDRYRAVGLVIPASIDDFLTCRLRGKATKDDYLPPPDSVIKTAFDEIERVRERDTNVYKAFWLAVGAGLRRKEIQHVDWSHLIEREGLPWISGGIGKDGHRIEVPMQSRAFEALKPFRKSSGKIIEGEVGLEWSKRLNVWMRHAGWTMTEKKMHELRAYVGSLIYQQSPLAAMKFMRHKTIKVTEQFYCRYGAPVRPVDVI